MAAKYFTPPSQSLPSYARVVQEMENFYVRINEMEEQIYALQEESKDGLFFMHQLFANLQIALADYDGIRRAVSQLQGAAQKGEQEFSLIWLLLNEVASLIGFEDRFRFLRSYTTTQDEYEFQDVYGLVVERLKRSYTQAGPFAIEEGTPADLPHLLNPGVAMFGLQGFKLLQRHL